jgi:beta-aspartyl-dipeptidase (metallo-type)
VEEVDATGSLVVPGWIDVHQHLIGAGGETGFASRTGEVTAPELAAAGITTVVGCLGTDGVSRHLGSLLAKAGELRAAGLNAHVYTGGFQLPPRTITGSVASDIVHLDPVVGVGEVAISDRRASPASVRQLAAVVIAARTGGRLAGKAGITHLHVGPSPRRLEPIRRLLDRFDVEAASLHLTHVSRSDDLLREAAALSRRGAWIDIDCVDEGVGRAVRSYLEADGAPDRLTLSSDANTPGSRPSSIHRELVAAVSGGDLALERLLPLVTTNPAAALKLEDRGRLAVGARADLVALREGGLEVSWTMAGGRRLGTGASGGGTA